MLKMNTMEAILRRRSVRKYTDQPVSRESLTRLLEAAMAAPSAHNRQPWEFLVITDQNEMSWLRTMTEYTNYVAPAAVVVCGNRARFLPDDAADFWVQDCTAALQSMLLAAEEEGLGTVWLGVYPIAETVQKVQAHFSMSADIIPLGVVYVGYAARRPEPRTQYEERFVHWEKMGGK